MRYEAGTNFSEILAIWALEAFINLSADLVLGNIETRVIAEVGAAKRIRSKETGAC